MGRWVEEPPERVCDFAASSVTAVILKLRTAERPPGWAEAGGNRCFVAPTPARGQCPGDTCGMEVMSEEGRAVGGEESQGEGVSGTGRGCPSRGLSRAPCPAYSSQDSSLPASGPLQAPPG